MPLMHAEDEDLHDLCVTSLEAIQQAAPAAVKGSIEGHLVAAREHRDIIRRFGRFPHRNKVLGRDSSDDERLFLETHSGYGQ